MKVTVLFVLIIAVLASATQIKMKLKQTQPKCNVVDKKNYYHEACLYNEDRVSTYEWGIDKERGYWDVACIAQNKGTEECCSACKQSIDPSKKDNECKNSGECGNISIDRRYDISNPTRHFAH
uniref:Uncharacterized protein n=1 Tax=Euplotes crassus TaxID=5936 RepID=A0A7S3KPT7_EUPCR|mmetsp:Transcript_3631/g.3376  ORF Transcript_3631/g.3376 Transcript_3631/m.3376 type:complete len:123 (+) Transcript_3631:1-369(+)